VAGAPSAAQLVAARFSILNVVAFVDWIKIAAPAPPLPACLSGGTHRTFLTKQASRQERIGFNAAVSA